MSSARRVVKRMLGGAALLPGVAGLTRRSLRGRTNVVYYHYVGVPTPYYADFYAGCTLERFAADLDLLERHFEIVPLARVLREDGGGAKPLLAVTFDDGFDLVRSGASALLEKRGLTATTFLITSCVDNANLMWRNKVAAVHALTDAEVAVRAYNEVAPGSPVQSAGGLLAASRSWPMDEKDELADRLWAACGMPALGSFLDEHRPYLSWAELDDWVSRGHGIGLHTRTHPFCSSLTPEQVGHEIERPATELKERFALEALPFSYPFGVRLPRELERGLVAGGAVSCALGIDGFAPAGSPPERLERANAEAEFRFSVFGRPLLGLPRRSQDSPMEGV